MVVDIYLALGTDPKGDNCFSIYQNNGIKMEFSFKTFSCSFSFVQKIKRIRSELDTAATADSGSLLEAPWAGSVQLASFTILSQDYVKSLIGKSSNQPWPYAHSSGGWVSWHPLVSDH